MRVKLATQLGFFWWFDFWRPQLRSKEVVDISRDWSKGLDLLSASELNHHLQISILPCSTKNVAYLWNWKIVKISHQLTFSTTSFRVTMVGFTLFFFHGQKLLFRYTNDRTWNLSAEFKSGTLWRLESPAVFTKCFEADVNNAIPPTVARLSSSSNMKLCSRWTELIVIGVEEPASVLYTSAAWESHIKTLQLAFQFRNLIHWINVETMLLRNNTSSFSAQLMVDKSFLQTVEKSSPEVFG